MIKLPIVTLDKTLADLYGVEDRQRVACVLNGYPSGVDMAPDMPGNKKYLFQEPVTMMCYKDNTKLDNPVLRREIQVKYMAMVTQRDSFALGDMPVVFFTFDEDDEKPRTRMEAEKTTAILPAHQRQRFVFTSSPRTLPECLKEHEIDSIAPKILFDGLDRVACIAPIDKLWYLNTKMAVYESGLPTPSSTSLKLDPLYFSTKSVCSHCSSDLPVPCPDSCSCPKRAWCDKQEAKVLSSVSSWSVPFVLKTNQTGGGAGTFIVTSEEERQDLIRKLSSQFLPAFLSSINESNAHLQPGTMVFMEYVQPADLRGNWGLTFFVTRTGESKFISVTTQKLYDQVRWLGSLISFQQQEELERKFTPIMRRIAAWAHEYGYFGPIGADILEVDPSTRTTGADESGFLVVDLNVRMPGSIGLGFLKGHFSDRRGLHEACTFFVTVKTDREEFMEQLKGPFEDGSVVINSWYWSEVHKLSYGTAIVAGATVEEMEALVHEVQKHVEELHV